MSSTNRGTERREHDFYATPEWCTKALFQHMDELRKRPVLDPCAGDGAILKVAQNYRLETRGIEIRDVPAPFGVRSWRVTDSLAVADGLNGAAWGGMYGGCNIVTNPPYSLAQEFIEAWRDKVEISAWLLRLNFLGSQKRAEWFRRRPPSRVLILPKRPSFVQVHGKRKGSTDSCEYAWFVWNSKTPRNLTFINWLEVTP